MRTLAAIVLFTLALLGADGWYRGTWEGGGSGNGGKLNVRLSEQPELSFTFEGTEIKAKNVQVKTDGDKVEVRFDYVMDGEMQGTLTGTRTESAYEGKYTAATKSGDVVDGGTFKLKAE